MHEADHIVSLTHAAKDEIQSWFKDAPITVIPTCVDLEHFDPAKIRPATQAEIRKKSGIASGDLVLLYLGSLGTWYRMDEMLAFFSALKKQRQDARFLIVSPDVPDLRDFEFRNDVVHLSASREEVPALISIAHAGIFFIKPSFSKKASSATKMAEMLAMGIPVVTNEHWGDVDYFKNTLQGFIAMDLDSDYTKTVRELLQVTTAPSAIRQEAVQHFSLPMAIARYGSVYQDLI